MTTKDSVTTSRAETFAAARVLFNEDTYGYPARPGTLRTTISATRLG